MKAIFVFMFNLKLLNVLCVCVFQPVHQGPGRLYSWGKMPKKSGDTDTLSNLFEGMLNMFAFYHSFSDGLFASCCTWALKPLYAYNLYK